MIAPLFTIHSVLYTVRDETDVSAEKEEAIEDARVPDPFCEHERASPFETASPQGSRAPLHVMPQRKSLARSDFARIAAARFRREHGALFSLSYGTFPDLYGGPKIACVVSKKVAPRAVDRNLIKRRCRAAGREHLKKIPTSAAFVFYAKKGAGEASFTELKREIATLVENACEHAVQ